MKNKKFILTAIFGIWIAGIANADTSRVGSAQDLGIGPMLGQPMGASAKYWFNSTVAADVGLGYHFDDNLAVHSDILWHSFSSFGLTNGRLPFYLGAGGRVLVGDDSQFGIRLPLGISFLPSADPLEFFFELAPVVQLAPDLDADLDGVIGIRLYLNYIR